MKDQEALHPNLDAWAPGQGATHADLGRARVMLMETAASGRDFAAGPIPQAQAGRPRILFAARDAKAAVSPAKLAHLSSMPLSTPLDFDCPDWARGLQASQILGPFEREGGLQEWVKVFPQVDLVPVQRDLGGSKIKVLAYIPLSISGSDPTTEIHLSPGTVQIAVGQLVPGQSAKLFAGTRVKTGRLKCASGLVRGHGTITVAADAVVELSLELDPQPAPAGNAAVAQDAGDLTVNLPDSITFTFKPNGGWVNTLAKASLTAYGTPVEGEYKQGKPLYYQWQNIKELIIPYSTKELTIPSSTLGENFEFVQVSSKLLRLQGEHRISQFAFSMPVAEAQGTAFGEMAQPGALFLSVQGDVPARWLAMTGNQEFKAAHLWFSPGVIGTRLKDLRQQLNQNIWLWQDKNNEARRCQWRLGYDKGADLAFLAVAGEMEWLVLGVQSEVRADRPVKIDGSRIPIKAIPTLVSIMDTAAGRNLAALGWIPPQPGSQVVAADYLSVSLENGILTTGKPAALALEGTLADWEMNHGSIWFAQPTVSLLMTLPDPYVINYNNPLRLQGAVFVEVKWVEPAEAELSLALAPEALQDSLPDSDIFGKPPRGNRLLFDVSGFVDQFGVQYRPNVGRLDLKNGGLQINRNAVAAPGALVDLTTLPSISWEPMVALPLPPVTDDSADPTDQKYPEEYQWRVIRSGTEGDGDFDTINVPSVKLVRIAPEIVFQEYAAALGRKPADDFLAKLHLPFGLLAHIDTTSNAHKPHAQKNQPKFATQKLAGGLQLKLLPFQPESPRAVFDGHTKIVGFSNDCAKPCYGHEVLGCSVGKIFNKEFKENDTRAVPVRRYDLSGYGASIYSDWRDPDLRHLSYRALLTQPHPDGVGVVKAAFEVCVGRTASEEIIVQAVICPWGIKVRRTVTMKRRSKGWVVRRDSGWVAITDSLFISFNQVHHGLIDKLVQVENIVEVKDVLLDSMDSMQAVRFDAKAIINNNGGKWLKSGKVEVGTSEAVACREVWGYLYLDPQPPPEPPEDLKQPNSGDTEDACTHRQEIFGLADRSPARGKVACDIDVGGCGQILRATQIEAMPVLNSKGEWELVLALTGSPVLPRQGAWSVTRRTQTDASPQALAEDYPVPVIQPDGNDRWHFADPRDLFRLKTPGGSGDPGIEYGFLQGTGTQKIYFPHPQLEKAGNNPSTPGPTGNLRLPDTENFQLADVRGLLRSTGLFPGAAEALLTNLTAGYPTLGPDGFSFTKDWTIFPDTLPFKTEPLLETDAVKLALCYGDAERPGEPTFTPKPTKVTINVRQSGWKITAGPVSFELHAFDCRLLAVSIEKIEASHQKPPQMINPQVVLGKKLELVAKLLKEIQNVAEKLPSNSDRELTVDFANGKLTIGQSVFIPNIPLGFGTVNDVLLELGGSVSFLPPAVSFGLGLGSEKTPMTLIITPFAGTALVRLAISESGPDIVVRVGVGIGIAINIAVARGHASIVIAIEVKIGEVDKITGLLTGHAGVDVLGGVASASLTLEAAAGIDDFGDPMHLSAYVSVGIHISICWVIDIDFDGTWPFETDLNR